MHLSYRKLVNGQTDGRRLDGRTDHTVHCPIKMQAYRVRYNNRQYVLHKGLATHMEQ